VITCSIGVAEWEAGDTVDSLLRRADVALYEAKRSGRNRVVAADTFAPGKEHDNCTAITCAPSTGQNVKLLQYCDDSATKFQHFVGR
jgi:predicted signal transduction protein with EAL and GGDEF domain